MALHVDDVVICFIERDDMNSATNVSTWRTCIKTSAALFIAMVLAASLRPVVRADIPQVASGTWTASGELGRTPAGGASVGLADGRLLVVGGKVGDALSDAISAYDPVSGAWNAVGRLSVARSGHAIALLKDGRVLIAGGTTGEGPTFDIEIYDPATASSAHAGDMTLPRTGPSAATLKDGRVLIVGGSDGNTALTIAETFDPATGQSAGIAAQLSTARTNATATTMLDGHVLVVGGTDGENDLASAEIFDPTSGTFFSTGSLQTARSGHVAVLLPNNNQVLIAGGTSAGTALASAELFADWRDGFAAASSQMSAPRTGAVAGGLMTHDLALVGGGGATSAEYYGYATVKTDREDYWPGEIVTITGGGWQPGETVTLTITEDADTHHDFVYSAVADENGNITNAEFAPIENEIFQHFGKRFYVRARGAASDALNTFTDGNGTITGDVRDAATNEVIAGATITCTNACNNSATTATSGAGTYTLTVQFPGNTNTISVTASATGYASQTLSAAFTKDTDTQTVNFRLSRPNRVPTANVQGVTANEDVAETMTLTGSDPDGNPLTFAIVTNPLHGTLGSIGTVTCSGTPSSCSAPVTYTPAADYGGSDSFTFKVNDGTVDSPAATVNITVNAVNDAPSFTTGAAQTVVEDSAAQTAAGWATTISAGPNESGQTLTFTTSNDNTGLFSVQPAISSNGTLTYTPAPNAFGTATVTVILEDDGGTANGGVDASTPQTFSITVTAVNDAPSFTKGADATVFEDAGQQTVIGWASGISAGPNETGQVLTFTAINNNSGLFSAPPAIAPNGTLTYTPAPNANGSATVTVVLQDDGGTENGGVDTTPPQSFVINVTAVNDAPAFTRGPDQTVAEDAGPQTVAWATGIDAGPADEAGQALAFSTSNSNPALFSIHPSVAPDGTLTYASAPDAYGSATVTVQLRDDGGTANGGHDSSIEQTFVITVIPVNDAPRRVSVHVAPPSIDEGGEVTLTVNFEDPDAGDAHAVTILWGDGTTGPVALPTGTFTLTAMHRYADDTPSGTPADSYGIFATVSDAETSTTAGPAAVTVKNVAPVIATFSGPSAPQPLGQQVAVTATFSDVGVRDTHSCTVHWDDGTETVIAASGGTCTVPHTFLNPGVYSVTVTVTDDDTGHAGRPLETEYIVIFDPTGGAVTGGGWIHSPPGSSLAYPNATGKANFGFVSKYKKGSYVPEGQTEFQFKAGDLNFHSSSYDFGSLVVSGWKAQYRGTGIVNGVPGYRFVLTAYDGQRPGGDGIDRLRMKITLNGNVIYDNGTGESEDIDLADPTAISGGSIVIHR